MYQINVPKKFQIFNVLILMQNVCVQNAHLNGLFMFHILERELKGPTFRNFTYLEDIHTPGNIYFASNIDAVILFEFIVMRTCGYKTDLRSTIGP